MLSITNLHVAVGDKPILKGLTLDVSAGEAHAVVGPHEVCGSVPCYVAIRRKP